MKNEHEDPGSFGETTAPASGKSFLKRQYMGYSLPVWAGCALIILVAIWYKFLQMQALLSHRPLLRAGQSP